MTKSRPKNKPRKLVRRRRVKRRGPVAIRARLDFAARAYARLLADPCGAPLVRSIGLGTGDSIIVRVENDTLLFNGLTETGGWGIWCPSTTVALAASPGNDATTGVGDLTKFPAPAGRLLASSASGVRCVSACLQIMYPGTELNRSGVIAMGVAPASLLSRGLPATSGGGAIPFSTSQIRTLCQFTSRMPENMAEIIWRPGPDDQFDYDLSVSGAVPANFAPNIGNRNAIIFSVAGVTANVGVRVRTVAVFEYTPVEGLGFAASVETPRSMNTTNDVLLTLDETEPNWWMPAARQARRHLSNLAVAGVNAAAQALIGGGGRSGGYSTRNIEL